MRQDRGRYVFVFSFLFLVVLNPVVLKAQSSEQEQLEAKREQLQKEIEQINHLLFAQKEKKGSVLDRMEAWINE